MLSVLLRVILSSDDDGARVWSEVGENPPQHSWLACLKLRWLDWGWSGKHSGEGQFFPVLSVVSRYEADSQYESCGTDGDEDCWEAVGELRVEAEGGIRVDLRKAMKNVCTYANLIG